MHSGHAITCLEKALSKGFTNTYTHSNMLSKEAVKQDVLFLYYQRLINPILAFDLMSTLGL